MKSANSHSFTIITTAQQQWKVKSPYICLWAHKIIYGASESKIREIYLIDNSQHSTDIDSTMNRQSFGSNILKAIVIKLPPIDFPIPIRIHLCKKLFILLLHHFLIEVFMTHQLLPYPTFQLLALKHITSIFIVLFEDVLHEFLAIRIHMDLNLLLE